MQSCFDTSHFSVQIQEVKLRKNFDHFKYSLHVNKKNIWGMVFKFLSLKQGIQFHY